MPSVVRYTLALVLVIAAAAIGLPMMWGSEVFIDPGLVDQLPEIYRMPASRINELPGVSTMVKSGLMPYFQALGMILFAVAVGYIIADGENKLTTLKQTDQEEG